MASKYSDLSLTFCIPLLFFEKSLMSLSYLNVVQCLQVIIDSSCLHVVIPTWTISQTTFCDWSSRSWSNLIINYIFSFDSLILFQSWRIINIYFCLLVFEQLNEINTYLAFAFSQVKEHLEIFANIKGVKDDCLENVVIEMAEEVSSLYSLRELGPLITRLLFSIFDEIVLK